jgi:simple sugar transport system permease protein
MVRPGAPRDAPLLSRLARHPEFGALVTAVALFTFFAIVGRDAGFLSFSATAGWLNAAAELGIVVVPVALLMIAGEFDLSVGSVLGGATIITAAGSGYYDLPLFVSVAIALAFGVVVGLGNGLLVNRTHLPSFIVTLAANYVCLGVALGASRALTSTSTISLELSGFWKQVFAAKVDDFNIAILWWLAICAGALWVLRRTPFGAWICAAPASPRPGSS